MSAENLVRACIGVIEPYGSLNRPDNKDAVWLDANESSMCEVTRCSGGPYNRYPEEQPREVRRRYAAYAGVSEREICITRGADEGIELIIRTFCEPGRDAIMIVPPTYGMYEVSAKTLGVDVKKVPSIAETFDLDVNAMFAALGGVRVIFVCSPNNPTGMRVKKKSLEAILEATQHHAIVVLDEAYIDFCEKKSLVKLIQKYDNLMILRTMSKAFALAGIRCGYVLAQEKMIEILLKSLAPYPVPAPVADIAQAALSQRGLKAMRKRVKTTQELAQQLFKALTDVAYVKAVYPSEANFIFVKCLKSRKVLKRLAEKNVFIRSSGSWEPLTDCLRITVGSEQENKALIKAMKEIEEEILR